MVASHRPRHLAEALKIRADGAIPLAGGTDLMVKYRAKNGMDAPVPRPVVFIDKVSYLHRLYMDGNDLIIGAAVPLAVLAKDPGTGVVQIIPGILQEAAANLGAPALRQRATIGGNIANASPAGDMIAALYALDAYVELASIESVRSIPIADFITGPGSTVLKATELITAVRIPQSAEISWHYWRKVGTRRANALTKVSLAASCTIKDGCIMAMRMAFGAVGPTVIRAFEAEKMFLNQNALDHTQEFSKDSRGVTKVLDAIRPYIKPINDQRSTAHYRRTVAVNIAGEAIEKFKHYIQENSI